MNGRFEDESINIKMMTPGRSPKDRISASESSCLPISDFTCSILAMKPSRKSKIAAIPIKMAPVLKLSAKANVIPIQPLNKFKQVIVFGICFLISKGV